MTTAAVTPTMRFRGWNIQLLIDSDGMPFAGVFQPARNVFITFRDIVDEIRLSFEFPHESSDVLSQVAFGLVDMLNVTEDELPAPKFAHSAGLDQLVPALPDLQPDALENRAILRYQFFKHQACTLTADQSFQCHVEAGCAQRISRPVRRLEPRYLPPKKASIDPRFATYPLRKTIRGRKSASPPKRSASGSMSPSKDSETDQADEDLASMVAPPECNISDERAKTAMANFRSSCLTSTKHCAVTGMGRSWCDVPNIGPALQACHIVSQLHYHTYHPPQADADVANPQQLEQAWERTWTPDNGILLFSHLHDMFDQRLFSIHPETLIIRVFMPYDILLAYHGLKAKVKHWMVAKAALRHHYDMCCIENMAARMPFAEQLPRSIASTSGLSTPLRLAQIASPRILESPSEQNQGQDEQRPDGDPAKRARQTGRQRIPGNANTSDISGNADMSDISADELAAPPSFKRKRNYSAIYDGYITPENGKRFLADVNWELENLARDDEYA